MTTIWRLFCIVFSIAFAILGLLPIFVGTTTITFTVALVLLIRLWKANPHRSLAQDLNVLIGAWKVGLILLSWVWLAQSWSPQFNIASGVARAPIVFGTLALTSAALAVAFRGRTALALQVAVLVTDLSVAFALAAPAWAILSVPLGALAVADLYRPRPAPAPSSAR